MLDGEAMAEAARIASHLLAVDRTGPTEEIEASIEGTKTVAEGAGAVE